MIKLIPIFTFIIALSGCGSESTSQNDGESSPNNSASVSFEIRNSIFSNSGAPASWANIEKVTLRNTTNNITINTKDINIGSSSKATVNFNLSDCNPKAVDICVWYNSDISGNSVAPGACKEILLQCSAYYICDSALTLDYTSETTNTLVINPDGTTSTEIVTTEYGSRRGIMNCL